MCENSSRGCHSCLIERAERTAIFEPSKLAAGGGGLGGLDGLDGLGGLDGLDGLDGLPDGLEGRGRRTQKCLGRWRLKSQEFPRISAISFCAANGDDGKKNLAGLPECSSES